MADVVTIGRAVKDIQKSPLFPETSAIRSLVSNTEYIESGDDSGYVFEITSPWATQAQTDWLAGKMRGYAYQPYAVDTGLLDPAAELGDYISIRGVFGGLFQENIEFGSDYRASFGAPADEEIDHEYAFETSKDRKYMRRLYEAEAQLTIQSTEIAAKVSKTSPTGQTAFGWSLQDNQWIVYDQSGTILKVSSNGAEISGKVTATSGEIGGAEIENGVLTVDTVNIRNGAVTGGVASYGGISYPTGSMALGSVAYGNTASGVQGTLTQVGINKANIETLYGYFTGSASFSSLNASVFYLNGQQHSNATIPIDGLSMHIVTWGYGS